MTKIDIISGFLGAGKTTLIKKLIKEELGKEKLVLIENEFGEIGIDSGFLKEGGVTITEMNSGCICCSLVGDFGVALKEVLVKYEPDRIVIEPSGVGKLSDVIKAVQEVAHEDDIRLNGKVAVVDVLKCKMYLKNFGEFFKNQIEHASCIILSRTQKASLQQLESCVALLRQYNEQAHIVTTPWDEMQSGAVLQAIEGKDLGESLREVNTPECGCHHHHHEQGTCACGHHDHHHAEEVFESWGIETPKQFDEAFISELLNELAHTKAYGDILRAKGILQDTQGKWFGFDMVPGEYEMRPQGADYTGRVCVIGTKLDKEKLEAQLGGK